MKSKLGIFVLTTVAALGASLVATPAEAGHKHPKHHAVHRSHPGHGPQGFHSRHGSVVIGPVSARTFVVPRHIRPVAQRAYRPYFHERFYFGPHRHFHEVYYFPVRTRAGLIWRPYYYCNGDLLVGHVDYYGPRVSFHITF